MKNLKAILEANKAKQDKANEKPVQDDNKAGKEDKVPAGGKTMTDQKYNVIDTTPSIPPLNEEDQKGKHVVATFGRMNPPTTGHEKLVNHVKKLAEKHGGEAHVYLSHSHDAKKNPLSYEHKHKLAHEAFGNVVKHTPKEHAHMLGIAKHLNGKADHLHFVVGSDRVEEAKKKLHQYNGKDYHFKSIHVHSAGERDPDADDTSGMSASKMRAHAHAGEHEHFKAGLPDKLKHKSHEIMKHVRGDIKEDLDESFSLNAQQRQKRAIQFSRIKNRVELGRKRALRRRAPRDALVKRSRRLAIKNMRNRILHGQKYSDLSYAARAQVDARLKKRKKSIGRIAQRLLPKVARAEAQRKIGGRFTGIAKGGAQHVSEELLMLMVNSVMEDMDYELTAAEVKSLQEKAKREALPYDILESVFRRGLHDWTLNEDTSLGFQEYAFNRVNSFISGGAAWDMDFDLFAEELKATPDGPVNTPQDGYMDNVKDDAAQTAVARLNSNPVPHRTTAKPGKLKTAQIIHRIHEEAKKPEAPKPGEKQQAELESHIVKAEKALYGKDHARAKPALQALAALRSLKPEQLQHGITPHLDTIKQINGFAFGANKLPKLEEEAMDGTKRRIDMPQLTDFHAFKKDLEDAGHKMSDASRKPEHLEPSQKHFNQEKVDRLIASGSHKDKPIIVSKDDKIIDGHHRWEACRQAGCEVKTRQTSLKADELFDFVKGKPYVEKKGLNESVSATSEALKKAFADQFIAYFKAHSAHWNVIGTDFQQAHGFFGDIYKDLWEGLDEIAEQQRQIQQTAASDLTYVLNQSSTTKNVSGKSFTELAKEVYDANEIALASLKAAYDAAESEGHVGVSNVIQNRISLQQKHSWMLRSTFSK